MTTTWTISRVQDWTSKDFAARGFRSWKLEADLLLCHALGLRRVDLYARFDQPLSNDELAKIRALVERRRKHEPVAYITGSRGFYGRDFAVDPRVLIPRPETELLIEIALESLPALGAIESVSSEPDPSLPKRRALDVGTGSGILAITLACERHDLLVDAVDLSEDALSVARHNAERLGVSDRVRFLHGSLLEPVRGERYSVILSNPPYIARAEIDSLMPDVRQFEPHTALDGGESGLELIEPLIHQAREAIEPGGLFAIEFGHDQGRHVLALAHAAGFRDAVIKKDLAGLDRVLIAHG